MHQELLTTKWLISLSLYMYSHIHTYTQERDPSVDIDLIELRTLKPLDMDTIRASLSRTHKLAILDESTLSGGVGATISALVNVSKPPLSLSSTSVSVSSVVIESKMNNDLTSSSSSSIIVFIHRSNAMMSWMLQSVVFVWMMHLSLMLPVWNKLSSSVLLI